MNAAIVAVQELLAFTHDCDICIGAQNFAALKELVGAHGDNDRPFVAMFFDVVMRQGPLLPFSYGCRCHASSQYSELPRPTKAKAS